MSNSTEFSFSVTEEHHGERLDKYLADVSTEISRSRVKALVLDARVKIDGETLTDVSYRVKCGQQIDLIIPAAIGADPVAQEIALDIVYEDDYVIVLNKPAGMVVHPAAGNEDGTLVNALLAHCGDSLSGIGGVKRPGIVHRIDKDTSGLMVVAKNDIAHHSLSEQFAAHTLDRAYWAVVWGIVSPKSGTVVGRIGRSPVNRKKMAIVTRGGRDATTHYEVVKYIGNCASLVECRLETGRTHQIRVHMTSLGYPLVGDPLYGRQSARTNRMLSHEQKEWLKTFNRQALFAYKLGFIHPKTGEKIYFEAPLDNEIKKLLDCLNCI